MKEKEDIQLELERTIQINECDAIADLIDEIIIDPLEKVTLSRNDLDRLCFKAVKDSLQKIVTVIDSQMLKLDINSEKDDFIQLLLSSLLDVRSVAINEIHERGHIMRDPLMIKKTGDLIRSEILKRSSKIQKDNDLIDKLSENPELANNPAARKSSERPEKISDIRNLQSQKE